MPERLGQAVLELTTDDRKLNRGLIRARERAERVAGSFERIGRRMSLALTAPLLGFAALSVKAASDVEELTNLIGVTFGDATEDVEEWSERTAAAVNRSRFELLRAAGDFAAFLKPLGVAPAAVLPMAKALAQLTTDISSFRNIAERDVFTALFSGLAGETEAVRRLGIDIGQAAVETELLRLGFKGSANEASQALKVIARFNLIVAQTGDAQGDAARTSQSFENRLRGLGAAFADLKVRIGQDFLAPATEMIGRVTGVVRALEDLEPQTRRTALAIAGIAAGIGPALIALGLLVRGLGFALAGLRALAIGVLLLSRAFVVRFVVAIGGVIAALAVLALASEEQRAKIQPLFDAMDKAVDTVLKPLGEEFQNLQSFIVDSAEALQGLLDKLPGGADLPDPAKGVGDLVKAMADLTAKTKDADEAGRALGFTFTSALEDAIIRGEGLRDVVRALADDIQRIILRRGVSEPLGDLVSAGVGAVTDFITEGVLSLFGPTALQLSGPFQHGGSFRVAGPPGVDRSLVAFRASRGEEVTVTPPGRGAGAEGITINQFMDLRGADAGVFARAELFKRQVKQETVAAVFDLINMGGRAAQISGRRRRA